MSETRPKHILIIRLSSLGDVLLTTPLLSSIKQELPEANISFLVRKEYGDILRHNPQIDNLLELERSDDSFEEMIKIISSESYDLILDLQNNLRSKKLLTHCSGEVRKFKKHNIKKFLFVHCKIQMLKTLPPIPERYILDTGFRVNKSAKLELHLPDTVKPSVKGKQLIGFCPGAKHYSKRYPYYAFIELGKMLQENGFMVVLFGGKDDYEVCNSIADALPDAMLATTENDIYQLAKDMQQCDAIVCNDSGLMHVACAMGVPVVTIFGSTVKEFGFAPYKNSHFLMENNYILCRPCSHIGKSECPKKHFKCMKTITPKSVFEHIKSLISYE